MSDTREEIASRLEQIAPVLLKIGEHKADVWKSILEKEHSDSLFDFAEWAHNYLCHLNTKAAPSLPSTVGATPANQWVIVSLKEGRGLPYWRTNSAGYADSISQAGFYSYEEATKIVAGNHGDDEKYCIDDPALAERISRQNYMRGKELALWLENAALKAKLSAPLLVEEGGAGKPGALAHKDALVAIREWHEECEYAVLKRGDKDYIQAANYAPEYMRAVNLLLNIVSPTDGKCVACNAVRYVLPGQTWGSCSNNECAAYKEDVASASYLDEAPAASPTTKKGGSDD